MPRAPRVCRQPGCPELVAAGYCTEHAREHERRRGSREARGYARPHRKLRAVIAQQVASGQAVCHLCGYPIRADDDWHLDHSPDRTTYRGPAHAACNTADGGRRAHN